MKRLVGHFFFILLICSMSGSVDAKKTVEQVYEDAIVLSVEKYNIKYGPDTSLGGDVNVGKGVSVGAGTSGGLRFKKDEEFQIKLKYEDETITTVYAPWAFSPTFSVTDWEPGQVVSIYIKKDALYLKNPNAKKKDYKTMIQSRN